MKYEIFFFTTSGPISTKHGTTHLWETGIHLETRKDYSVLKEEIISIFFRYQRYGKIISCANMFINWNCFSVERCGPWVFCLPIYFLYFFLPLFT